MLELTWVSFGVLCVTALASVVTLSCLVTGRPHFQSGAGRIGAFVFGGSATLLAIGQFLITAAADSQNPVQYNGNHLLIAAAVAIFCGLFLSTARWIKPAEPARTQPALWGFLAAILAIGGWSYSQFAGATQPRLFVAKDLVAAKGELKELPNLTGLTDRGRPIELLRWIDSNLADADADSLYTPPNGNGGMLRSGPSDMTNCHGWIFTGGRHCISGEVIPQILEDNGYQAVFDPQAGDLVVYRNQADEILHTALVRGRLDDGTLIVESKFGMSARFLHMPHDQPYSDRYDYYRTGRGNHLIIIRPTSKQNTYVSRHKELMFSHKS